VGLIGSSPKSSDVAFWIAAETSRLFFNNTEDTLLARIYSGKQLGLRLH